MKQFEFPPHQVSELYVNWHENSEQHWYEAIPGTIKADTEYHSLAFQLRPNDPLRDEDPCWMIIRHLEDLTTVKTDALEGLVDEFEAKLFGSTDELLAYSHDDTSEIYVHIYLE